LKSSDYSTLKLLLEQEFLTVKGTFNGKKPMPASVQQQLRTATDFLDYDASNAVRASYILADATEQKKCSTCNTPLQFSTAYHRSPKYCSAKCSATSQETKSLRKQTVTEKYGVDNVAQSASVKQHIVDTMMARYGVDNPSKLDAVKQTLSEKNKENAAARVEKVKQTVRDRYGVDHHSKLDAVKEKKKNTVQARYGVDCTFQSAAVQEAIKTTMLDRYGVDNASKSPELVEKIKQTKLARYNNSAYNNRSAAAETMQRKYGAHSSQLHWDAATAAILSDPTAFSEVMQHKTASEVAAQLGIAITTVFRYINQYTVWDYKARTNQYERLVQQWLTEAGVVYIKNSRTVIPPYEIDFYLPDYNLCIELNGVFWHSELMGKDRHYHLRKTKACEQQQLQLLHLWDYQFDANSELIRSMLMHRLRKTNATLGARKTKIQLLSSAQYREFLAHSHIQGAINSRVRIGLEYNGEIVAVMGIGASRFESNTWELHRFAVRPGLTVQGAASKLLNYFLTNQENCAKIVSYASRDYSNGNLYQQLGFVQTSTTPPSYFYFKNRQVYNRLQFQKHTLHTQLEVFDPGLTEWENMQANGYNRFWDTGTIKYEFTR